MVVVGVDFGSVGHFNPGCLGFGVVNSIKVVNLMPMHWIIVVEVDYLLSFLLHLHWIGLQPP